MIPFNANPLADSTEQDLQSCDFDANIAELLPAAYCDKSFQVRSPNAENQRLLASQLRVVKLNSIHDWFFVLGLPRAPRPLHRQKLMLREVVITEEPELHLVWTNRRIYIKPLPRFLLCPQFWQQHLLCDEPCECQSQPTKPLGTEQQLPNSLAFDDRKICQRQELYQLALGFLISYIGLVANESDFHQAHEHHLLPNEINWPQWRNLCSEILSRPSNQRNINKRYRYGELRLSRINYIYRFRKGHIISGFLPNYEYDSYTSFFQLNTVRALGVFAFAIAILTALQTGLAVDRLAANTIFQDVSYVCVTIVLLAPFLMLVLGFVTFGGIFISNVIATARRRYWVGA